MFGQTSISRKQYHSCNISYPEYTDWQDVPEDRDIPILGPIEGQKFQIRTDAAIASGNDIRFFLKVENFGSAFVTFVADNINVKNCGPFSFAETAGFRSRGGIFTFLKTQTNLKIWFDDVLEADWDFLSVRAECTMKNKALGIQFHLSKYKDTASRQYRFSEGRNN